MEGDTEMRKAPELRTLDDTFTCVCCRCGRVSERGRTIADAVAKWDGHLYKYGPLKEETS